MIAKVQHLIRVNHDPAAPQPPKSIPRYDEAADAALLRKLAFDQNGISLETYGATARKKGKTPDFKLFRDGALRAFCEMKSPRDDYVFEFPPDGGTAIRKDVPFYRKLASHVRRAAKQFGSTNPDHAYPNILAFISHCPDIERRDLIATIAGLPIPGTDRRGWMLPPSIQREVLEAAAQIDLFLWIDVKKGTFQHLSTHGAPHQIAALDLLALPAADIGESATSPPTGT
jgi:hypothetical protein